MAKPKCGAGIVTTDGTETYTCDRQDGRHIKHRDASGTEFMRLPGGALITKPGK